MKPTMTQIKILLLVSTFVFAGDVGPFHPTYIPHIGTLSTILFAVLVWLFFTKNQAKPDTATAAYMGAMAVNCFLAGLMTIAYIRYSDPAQALAMYDSSSIAILLDLIIMNIAGLFVLKEK